MMTIPHLYDCYSVQSEEEEATLYIEIQGNKYKS